MTNFVSAYVRKSLSQRDSNKRSSITNEEWDESFERRHSVISGYLQERDVPTWFRGTSFFQINAANSLFTALRDDIEQQTTHRVHECIATIGLHPIISGKHIKLVMGMCRGNDLAFLWFLWELYYKTPGAEYSINEQLILSTITHLDMIPTLRALDRVLPPGQPPKTIFERQRRQRELMGKRINARRKKTKKHNKENCLPYFIKQRFPTPHGSSKAFSIPEYRVRLISYDKYKDKNYIVINESNRWFGSYNLHESKRIINAILNDEFDKIFADFALASLRTETIQSLCEHHKVIAHLENKLEAELKVIAREKCLEHLDLKRKHKEATRERIVDELNKEVDKYMCKFKKLTEKTRRETLCHILSSECAADRYNPNDCELLNLSIKDEKPCCNGEEEECETEEVAEVKSNTVSNDSIKVQKTGSGDANNRKASIDKPEISISRSTRQQQHGMGDCRNDDKLKFSEESIENSPTCFEKRSKDISNKGRVVQADNRNTHENFNSKYLKSYDYGHYDPSSPTLSETYFKAPNEHKPYKFDYRKIFRLQNTTEDSKPNIKKGFLRALESGVPVQQSPSVECQLKEEELEGREPDYNPAIRNLTQKLWKEGVEKKNEELEAEEKAKRNLKNMKTPLNYDLDYYDPEDKQLMHNLLKDALNYIAQDHRYVLASLPDASKLPTLREWIYVRYGKLYTREARFRELQMSMKIFRALDKITQDIPMPRVKMLGNQVYVDYSCRDYLIKKANYIKKVYYNLLDANIMEQARVFWFAMRPYLCSNGPPRNTYYAYMPARVVDITRFRMWKSSEYMDAKREWDKRRIMTNKRY